MFLDILISFFLFVLFFVFARKARNLYFMWKISHYDHMNDYIMLRVNGHYKNMGYLIFN